MKQPIFCYGRFTLRRIAVLSDWSYAARCSLGPGGSDDPHHHAPGFSCCGVRGPGKGQDNDIGWNGTANFVVTGQRIHGALQWRKRNQNRRSFGRKDDFPTEASGRCNGSSTITADG
jgi:hypothetical protein